MIASPVVSAAQAPTILVVEDEILLCEIIADELVDAGFRVLTATTGEEALTMLESTLGGGERIDVLFTDIRLPGAVDGWDLAEAVRRRCPDLPVIYASGYSVEQPRDVAGSHFLAKPYRPSAVIEALRTFGVHGRR